MSCQFSPVGGSIGKLCASKYLAGQRPSRYDKVMILEELNGLDRAGFVRLLGDVFEHSPWVAERGSGARPFADVGALLAALVKVVEEADPAEQTALLRAHPDLAGKVALAEELTIRSTAEQAGAGLDQLTQDEYERFHTLNAAYLDKFDFPFILAVKGHDKASILAAFGRRLENTMAEERETALAQVARIARFRIEALLEAP